MIRVCCWYPRQAGLEDPEAYRSTPLDFITEDDFCLDIVWQFYTAILRRLHIPLFSRPIRKRPHDRNRSDRFLNTELDMELVSFCFILGFCGSFLCAWNFYFPTPTERLLWRISSAYTLAFGIVGGVYVVIWHHKFSQANSQKVGECALNMRTRGSWVIRDFAAGSYSGLRVSRIFLVPITILCVCYCLARGYILVEDIVGLRTLPKSAYDTVEWSKYIPHLWENHWQSSPGYFVASNSLLSTVV